MESTWKRTLSSVFIFLSLSDVFGQNKVHAGLIPFPPSLVKEVNNECSNGNSRSPSSQLMNSLFTVAAANGVLPDFLPAFRTKSSLQEGQRTPKSLLEEPRQQSPIVNAPIVISEYSQGPVIPSVLQKPEIPPNPPPPFQVVSGTYLPPGLSPTMIPSLMISHDINQGPIMPPPLATIVPSPNCYFPQPGIEDQFRRPLPLLQKQPILDDYNPTIPPVFPEMNISNIQIDTIPTAEVMTETCECNTENSINKFQPTIVRDDFGQLPISLQINMPAQYTPAPIVTVITAAPTPAPPSEYIPPYPIYPPPMPPIIMEGSKSKLKQWLPLIMIALFNDGRQGCDGNGSSGCCCPCDCGSSNVPIPFPIPIPTNNPIVCSSRPRSHPNRGKGDGPNVIDNSN